MGDDAHESIVFFLQLSFDSESVQYACCVLGSKIVKSETWRDFPIL